MGGADERIFVKVPSPASTMLTGAVSVGPGGKVTTHSQIPTGAGPWRLKAPGVADAQDTPSITHRRGPKTHPEEGAQERQLGFRQRGFHGCTSLYLSDGPGVRSGTGGIDSLGHEVRMRVTYSSEARTVITRSYDSNHIVKFRGGSKRKMILKTIRVGCRF